MNKDLTLASEDRKRFSQLLNESISEGRAQKEAQFKMSGHKQAKFSANLEAIEIDQW